MKEEKPTLTCIHQKDLSNSTFKKEPRKRFGNNKIKDMNWNGMSDYIIVKAQKNEFDLNSSNYDVDDSEDDYEYELARKEERDLGPLQDRKVNATCLNSTIKVAAAFTIMTLVFSNIYLHYEIHGMRKYVRSLDRKFNRNFAYNSSSFINPKSADGYKEDEDSALPIINKPDSNVNSTPTPVNDTLNARKGIRKCLI